MKRSILLSFVAVLALGSFASADPLLIDLTSPTLIGAPGSLLDFTGTLTNTTGADLFLNADNFNLSGFDPSAIDDSPFFTNAPLFLSAGASTGVIDLFTITIPNGFTLADYLGAFQVIGGATDEDQTVIGSANFTVSVQAPSGVPEPSSLSLVLLAGAFVGAVRKWRPKNAISAR